MRRLLDYFQLATANTEVAPHSRSFVFSRTWSKYYRFPNFTVDLAFSGNKFGAVLKGYYNQRPNGIYQATNLILMHKVKEDLLMEKHFKQSGPFSFLIEEAGDYQFLAEAGEDVFELETRSLAIKKEA